MEINNIPDDLTESQFRKFVIQVLEGFDGTIKQLSVKIDSLINERISSMERKVEDIQKKQLSEEDWAKFKTQNRRYWISFIIAISSTIIAFLGLLLRK